MGLNSVGTGMVTPFLLIYLHAVRGFSLQTAGLVAAAYAGWGLVIGLAAGPLVDRFGGRPAAAVALILTTAGLGLFPLVRAPWHAFALVSVAGIGRGLFWPGYSTLLVALTPQSARAGSYAVQRLTGNLGLGLGSLAAGLIARTSDPSTFTILFQANAATYVLFLVALSFLREPPRTPPDKAEPAAGYREVLRHRAFIGAILIGGLFAAFGVAQLNSMLPVFARSNAGVSERGIGLIFLCNTVAIVILQLPVAKALEGRRRMPTLALVGVLWAVSWLLALAAGAWFAAAEATIVLIGVGIVFGIGESLLGVVQGPLVADLASERLRGRYLSLWLIAAQLGFAIGPAVGGFLLAQSATLLWTVAAGVCLAAGMAALGLERSLPNAALRTPRAAEPAGASA